DEHTPVLAAEALAGLAVEAGGYYVDATFGRGGHTALVLQALGREGRLLALDRDPQAIAAGGKRFADEVRLTLVHASFADLGTLVPAHARDRPCRGVLFDLGVSSPQLDDPSRGFSFRADGPLDMRMDPTRGEPVSAWLARASVDEIRQVIATLGEERFARRVAQAIVAARREQPLDSTRELAALVASAVRTREPGKHPPTRPQRFAARGGATRVNPRRALALAVPLLWLAALGSAAGAIYCKHRARALFVELEALNARRDNLEIEWGQLQLEQSAWSTHAF